MRRINLPKIEPESCNACEGKGSENGVKCPACRGSGKQQALDATGLLRTTLNPPQGETLLFKDYKERGPIYDKLGVDGKSVYLEEAEWETLTTCIEKAQWLAYSPEVHRVLSAVMEAEKIEVAEVPNTNRAQRRKMR